MNTFGRLCFDSSISQFGCHVHEWATSIELSCRTTLVKYNDQVLTITETGELTKKAKGPIITINYKRVIEVWMDEEYKKFFYTRCLRIVMCCQIVIWNQREPSARYAGMGNITAQLELKKSLECKSFDWFINNVAYDMLEKVHRLLCHILK